MTDRPEATEVIRDPDSNNVLFRQAVNHWLKIDRNADPFEELELQAIAAGRLLDIKAGLIFEVERLDAEWGDLLRRLAACSEHRRQRYDEACDVAYLAALRRLEASYAADGTKCPAQTRLALEAKADASYLAEKERLRQAMLADMVSAEAEAKQEELRVAKRRLGRLDALIARVQGRYWVLVQLAKDRRMELQLTGNGRLL